MTGRSESTSTDFWPGSDGDVALDRFQTLVNTIDDGLYQLDSAEQFVAVNDVIVEWTGYSRDELLGSHVSMILAETDATHVERTIREHLQNGDTDLPPLELSIQTAAGDDLVCEVRYNLLVTDGEYQGSVGVVRDKRTETGVARTEREQQLAQYETIIETIEDGIYVLDDEYRFETVNQAYADLTGYSREELLGSHCSLVVEDTVSSTAADASRELADAAANAATIEADVLRKDGTRVPAESRFSPIVSTDGEYDGTVGVVRDISERKAREQELRQYETIVETVQDGIYVVDEEGIFTMVNESYAELLGYSPGELLGSHVSMVVEGDVHQHAQAIEDQLAHDEADETSIEATVQRADGTTIPAEATFAILPSDSDGRERVGVVRDITERKERERALEESEQRYRTLIDHFPGAVGLYNESFEYTVAGGELLADLGLSQDEIVGTTIYDRYPDDLVEQIEPYFQAVFDGESNTFEEQYHDRDLWAHTLPVRNSAGDIVAGMLMVQDITERKEYQREIEASNERLEQFAYAASHDLQEPLRMIVSYLQLIERRYHDELDEDGREFIDFAVDGAQRMQEMINGLLNYSRVQTRGSAFESVDLETVLENARDDLQVKIDESGAEITADPLPRVTGDPGQLRQVFQNLLSNAITYSGEDSPRIQISADTNDEECVISVRDEGIGIDVESQDRIFEVFQRLHNHEEHAGTGIGLALCQRIVERHGGEIWVESEPGEGATFTFTVPVASE
ncbi:PAS domain-containing sensor histidine kinase [Natrialba sp. SSL1]|uniref:PAS domain-containing sensor histidine kinase n=1 Tax=Natrialba sp. SSL1 TaxID=1869245 RepID=UPI00209BAAFB|nr:PAS domain S-box protein [Natrialba sp. SSL1]